MNTIKLVSVEDASINYVIPKNDNGYLESRFVQRDPSYLIVYLSSHTGCNQSCRMCYLTQTNQTMMADASMSDYLNQALNVLSELDFKDLKSKGLTRVKFSFMSRGEPLLNKTIQNNWEGLRKNLKSLVPSYLNVEFNISTILPKSFDKRLSDIFTTDDVVIYYSIYSLQNTFRKKWLGKAKDVYEALEEFSQFSKRSKARLKFHSAFIAGENDYLTDIVAMHDHLQSRFGSFAFNIVRYNPISYRLGKESANLDSIKMILNADIKSKVGSDVSASCGMFYNK